MMSKQYVNSLQLKENGRKVIKRYLFNGLVVENLMYD